MTITDQYLINDRQPPGCKKDCVLTNTDQYPINDRPLPGQKDPVPTKRQQYHMNPVALKQLYRQAGEVAQS